MTREQVAELLLKHAGERSFMYGSGIVGHYYGPRQKLARAAVVSALTGENVRPSDKRCGWGKFFDLVADQLGAARGCIAARESSINAIVFGIPDRFSSAA